MTMLNLFVKRFSTSLSLPSKKEYRQTRQLAENGVNVKPLPMLWILAVPVVLMLLLWLFPLDALDLWLADKMSIPGIGFPYKKNPVLESFLHDTVKQIGIAIGLGHLLIWVASFFRPINVDRRRWLYVFLAMALSIGVIQPLKKITEVQCPWSLDRYGGVEHYSSVFDVRPLPVEKVGNCWPAGHAATGFSFFALFFAWHDRKPKLARQFLYTSMGVGTVLAVGRMMQGAHFFSHNIWTILIDWLMCAVLYQLMLRKYK